MIATTPRLLDYPVIIQHDRSLLGFKRNGQPVLARANAPAFTQQLQRHFPDMRLQHYRNPEMALAAVAFGGLTPCGAVPPALSSCAATATAA